MTSRVFVVQQPATYDRAHKRFVAKYDLAPASVYGPLTFLLPPGNIFNDRVEHATNTLRDKLATFTANDYLLAVGDPVAIAAASLIAGENSGGIVQLLKWSRSTERYTAFIVTTR